MDWTQTKYRRNTYVARWDNGYIPYSNWAKWFGFVQEPNDDGNCIVKAGPDVNGGTGQWADDPCTGNRASRKYVCSVEAQETCDSRKAMENVLQSRTCMYTNTTTQVKGTKLPGIDLFVNPKRKLEKEKVISTKKDIAKNYFRGSDMQTLFPELFRILWESTLPCFKEENKEEHMMLLCEVATVEVNCSDIFTRVPTDSGMCCALNVEDSLRPSEYQNLIGEMQGEKKVDSRKRSGTTAKE